MNNTAPQKEQTESQDREVVVDVRHMGLFYPANRRRSILKRIHGSRKSGEFWALRDITFQCHQGDVLGVVGRNGAGKSTLSLVLSNIFEPDEGEVSVDGEISALLSIGGMFKTNLSGRDNTYYFGAFLGFSRAQIEAMIEDILDFSELGEFYDQPVGTYSGGMRARLAFSIASSIQPDVLILDEVLSVGDAAFRAKCEDRVREMTRQCRCIIVISHSMGSVRKMCNRVLWLDHGQIRKIGPTSEVLTAYKEAVAADKQDQRGLVKAPEPTNP